MDAKACSKCKEVKELTEFSKDKSTKDNLCRQCKGCRKDYYSNPEISIRIKKLQKEWFLKNKKNEAVKAKKWQLENKEKLKEYRKEYYSKPENKARAREYYRTPEQKEKARERAKTPEARIKMRGYDNYRRRNEPLYKLQGNLRSRTLYAFKSKGIKKNKKSIKILGVSIEVAKAHIERQFTKGMSWDNHGEWHIDHIIPLASANTEEELIKLCHYTNLQPLWAKDNLEKSDKIIETQMKLRI